MVTLKAHFDGKVFIPDEPVNVPVGTEARISLVGGEVTAESSKALLSPVIVGLDPDTARSIAEDPNLASEQM